AGDRAGPLRDLRRRPAPGAVGHRIASADGTCTETQPRRRACAKPGFKREAQSTTSSDGMNNLLSSNTRKSVRPWIGFVLIAVFSFAPQAGAQGSTKELATLQELHQLHDTGQYRI